MKKILIVDDDKIFTKVLKDGLLDSGDKKYEVVIAEDGEAGLEKVQNENPDLIVLDIMMPKLGGIEFLKKLKVQRGDLGTMPPVLVSSQLSDFEKISEGIELGIKGYIVKSSSSLGDIVKKVGELVEDPVM